MADVPAVERGEVQSAASGVKGDRNRHEPFWRRGEIDFYFFAMADRANQWQFAILIHYREEV